MFSDILTCVCDLFSESLLNTDTRMMRTLWHVHLPAPVLMGFHLTTTFIGRGDLQKPTRLIAEATSVVNSYNF